MMFREAVEVTGIVLTKLDGTAKGGIALAIAEELGVPVKLIGTGEALEDLRRSTRTTSPGRSWNEGRHPRRAGGAARAGAGPAVPARSRVRGALPPRGEPEDADYGYGREGSPTWTAYERALSELEGGEVVLLASGMAAAGAVLLTALRPGDALTMPTDCMHVRDVAAGHLERNGVEVTSRRPRWRSPIGSTCSGSSRRPTRPRPLRSGRSPPRRASAVPSWSMAPSPRRSASGPPGPGRRPLRDERDQAPGRSRRPAARLRSSGRSGARRRCGPGAATRAPSPVRSRPGWRTARSPRSTSGSSGARPTPSRSRSCCREGSSVSATPVCPPIPPTSWHGGQMSRFGTVLCFDLGSHGRWRRSWMLPRWSRTPPASAACSTAERRARWAGDDVPEGFIRLSAGCEAARTSSPTWTRPCHRIGSAWRTGSGG